MKPLLLLCFFASAFLPALAAEEGKYEVVAKWPALPEGRALGICAGIAVNSENQVLVFHRGARVWQTPFPTDPIAETTVWVIDGATGALVAEWGAGQFVMPHGLTIDDQGFVWLTDVALHQVYKCTAEGKVLMTLGERGTPGADAGHFNLPTDVAVLEDGSFYVSDGYKNTRVVRFGADGSYQNEWGEKGEGPGQFHLPHGIAVDWSGRVLVCDRENLRLQVFDSQGRFLDQWQGPQIGKPYGVEVGPQGNVFVIDGGAPSVKKSDQGKVVELDTKGAVVDTFGSFGPEPGHFQLGHDIAVGLDGAVYVAEATGRRVQKFVKKHPTQPFTGTTPAGGN